MATVRAIASAVDAHDIETAGHRERVVSLAITLARAYRLPESDFGVLRFRAVLHDVGKIGVPDAILRKPGALDDAEWAVIRRHPTLAAPKLAGVSFRRRSLPIVRHHRERGMVGVIRSDWPARRSRSGRASSSLRIRLLR